MTEPSAAAQIDALIEKADDWHGQLLARLRDVVLGADPSIIEEVKWKKPSRPEGVAVWSHEGIVCIGEMLKSAVRLTFPKGALLKDPKSIFNARLDSASVRAVDFGEEDPVDERAIQALVVAAMRANTPSSTKKSR